MNLGMKVCFIGIHKGLIKLYWFRCLKKHFSFSILMFTSTCQVPASTQPGADFKGALLCCMFYIYYHYLSFYLTSVVLSLALSLDCRSLCFYEHTS